MNDSTSSLRNIDVSTLLCVFEARGKVDLDILFGVGIK